jgi:hypothetical protein
MEYLVFALAALGAAYALAVLAALLIGWLSGDL